MPASAILEPTSGCITHLGCSVLAERTGDCAPCGPPCLTSLLLGCLSLAVFINIATAAEE